MQVSNTINNGVLSPPSGGSTPDIASQLSQQRRHHQKALRGHAWELWWPRILVVAIAGFTAGIFGQYAANYGKIFIAILVGLVILFYILRSSSFALFLTAGVCTAWAPPAGT